MILIDGLLAAPGRGLMFLLREIAKAAKEEQAGDERALMAELTALHRSLDRGEVSEDAFDAQEAKLLARLDRLHGIEPGNEDGSHEPE